MDGFLSGFLHGVGKKVGERVVAGNNKDPREEDEKFGYHTIYGINPKIFTFNNAEGIVSVGNDVFYIEHTWELRISVRTPTYRTYAVIPPGKWHSGIIQDLVDNLHSYDKSFFHLGQDFPKHLKKAINEHYGC